MSEAYNPETMIHQQIELLEIEFKNLAQKRDAAVSDDDRAVLQRQVTEVEHQIAILKEKLKP